MGVIAIMLFLLIYFNPSTSTEMVNNSVNFMLRAISAATLAPALIYCIRLGFRSKQFVCLAAAFFVFWGTFFIELFDTTASGFMLFGLIVAAIIATFYYLTDRMDTYKAVILIIAAGCIMRIGCGMAVPTGLDLHDYVFADDFSESFGHAKYIGYIAENLSLPQDYLSQNYHPPLHHIIGALFYSLTRLMGFNFLRFSESFQFVTGLYSCLTLIVWYKIFKKMGLRNKSLLVPLAILAFHPTGWIMGGCLNNDMLMWLLVSVCLLYLIKWQKRHTWKNVLIMAVSLGLAMMTKVSAVLIAPAIAFVFIHELYIALDSGSTKKGNTLRGILLQCTGFGCISIPLGMWHPIRNLVLFGQGFGYVPSLSAQHSQYIGEVPFLNRLFVFTQNLFDSPFVQWDGKDFSFLGKVLKTALFGETNWLTNFDEYSLLPGFLTIFNYALVIISLAAIVYVLKIMHGRKGSILYIAAALYYLVLSASHIYFSFQYPFQCTNDIRYTMANIGIGLLFMGKMLMIRSCRREEFPVKNYKSPKIVPLTVVFCSISVLIFVLDSFYRVF